MSESDDESISVFELLAPRGIFHLCALCCMENGDGGMGKPPLFSPPETQMKGYAASGARENMFVFALDASQREGRLSLPALCLVTDPKPKSMHFSRKGFAIYIESGKKVWLYC